MIESLFLWQSIREKHHRSPLLQEREQYLTHLSHSGTSHGRTRAVATLLLHIVRVMDLDALRPIAMKEIDEASTQWAADVEFHSAKTPKTTTAQAFRQTANRWLTFHRMLVLPPPPALPFSELLKQFLHAMQVERGLSPETLRGYGERSRYFLQWLGLRCTDLSQVHVTDTDEFIEEKRQAGWSPRSVATQCQAMRTFFGYAESQEWCKVGIRRSIKSPRVPKYEEAPRGPSWKEVRRLLRLTQGGKPSDLRAHAIFMLCAIYALRASEIIRLTLDDIDWRNETITVRRSKRGRTQQFPLQFEVGEALILYLQKGRPHCSCRSLFITRSTPYRPIRSGALWSITGKRMKALNIESKCFGAHSLRHACATQLLKKGSSLRDIADFLGHRDIKSVSIYAKYDIRSLRTLANFSLAGVL
jgi:integrase/recombinase XerD